jgi:hypothetical protein
MAPPFDGAITTCRDAPRRQALDVLGGVGVVDGR